jgi:hypothetical protein
MWTESKEWYGRLAKLTCLFYRAVVKEVNGVGIVWYVKNCDEVIARGTETDYGMAMHKAESTLFALTEGY